MGTNSESSEQSIVVVGMACVYPGAHSPEELWENVLAGRRFFRKAPAERFPADYVDADPNAPGKSYTDQMAVITDWTFDPIEFRIPPVTANVTDTGGLKGETQVAITIAPNTPPTITIDGPTNGTSFAPGDPVSFAGSASDVEDGDRTATLVWNSSIDGDFGTGGSFSTTMLSPGPHTITAQATDSLGISGSAQITITITGASTIDVRVSASLDDAEERISNGKLKLTSSDLELILDKSRDQVVGMRFNGINILQGATVTNAYVQFQADETSTVVTTLVVQGQLSDNALTFASVNGDITSRPRTFAAVSWSPASWNTKGEADLDQRTPNIKTVIQEIVNQTGWLPGNSIAIIITGTGRRTAESFDGVPAAAALLHVEWNGGEG